MSKLLPAALGLLALLQITFGQELHPDIGSNTVSSLEFHLIEFFSNLQIFKPAMIERRGYPVETHFVTTTDGYILQMHRIPQPGKPVVYLMHGSLASSADWILMGPESSIGN